MIQNPQRTLVPRDKIAARVRELGRQIASDIEKAGDGEIVLIPIMTGALVFAADLIRELPLVLSLRLVAVSSYPGATMASKGAKLASELPTDLAGKHVLIVDDILDSGHTLSLVRSLVEAQRPKSVGVCVLLRKPESVRQRAVQVEYLGFDIPNEFVVGYGLDFNGFYRNLPDIAVVAPETLGHAGAGA